ncbi:hypothetical protein C3942_04410 [Solimonas fluminis]|uniref:Uncharacterized protein n=1 Tax=Solimonas fluminis TaxID=2086571 RepID=A0A2S5TIV9_9GAMM|nr:hypothetical protein [Solimonas fluminis]PPE74926.1 hypothetical protein C3942_04410 [Solimonas fluminis]
MSEGLTLALVAGGFAVLGSLVTGWFTYITSVKQEQSERYKRRLLQAYADIAAFHRLEERYTRALETEDRSAESWKREMRRRLRDEGFGSPSEEATAQKAEQRIAELG